MTGSVTAATPIEQAQEYLASLDGGAAMYGWLVYDYQGVNPAFGDLTGLRDHRLALGARLVQLPLNALAGRSRFLPSPLGGLKALRYLGRPLVQHPENRLV